MSLLSTLTATFGEAFERRGFDPALGEVSPSQRPELGQFQCNGALAAGNQAGRAPRELAQEIIDEIQDPTRFADLSIAGPGFINITITDDYLAEWMGRLAGDERRGLPGADPAVRVIIDYGGPNVAKAMHVGHLRSTIIGDSLKRLFTLVGHDALGDIHFGDWGLPIGMLIVELRRRKPELVYFDPSFEGPYPGESPVTLDELEEMYPIAAARAEADFRFAEEARQATRELQEGRAGYRALWKHFVDVSRESQERDFAALGVSFDLWYGESTVNDRVEPMIRRLVRSGAAERSEGALIIRVDQPDDTREIPPLILEKSEGGYLYSTTDLATIEMRAEELKADLVLYVVDARQALHFEQLFRAARKTGIAPPSMALEHVPFGTINGPDGKPFKTRAGGVLRLSDTIDMVTSAAARRLEEAELAQEYPNEEKEKIARQVGVAALKFGDLANHRTSSYVLDFDRFTSFEGKTGPYLQYGAVRMKSILRKAESLDLAAGPLLAPSHPSERDLMLLLLKMPEIIDRTIETRAPNHAAEYAHEIATQFNRFYDHCHILRQEDRSVQASWLRVVETTLGTLELLLSSLGIEVPDRM
jgi:arginyl-tRNA synthetase